MHITILFDANSSQWQEEYEWNKLFVRSQQLYLMDCYKYRGYLYLNTIYEGFGIKWNPYEKNLCWIYERDGELDISLIINDNEQSKIGIAIVYNQSEKES